MLICTVFILKFFLFYVTYEARSTIVKEVFQDDDVVGPLWGASLYLHISAISDWKDIPIILITWHVWKSLIIINIGSLSESGRVVLFLFQKMNQMQTII